MPASWPGIGTAAISRAPVSPGMVVMPSPLLALVCLALVHRLKPHWVTITLADAAAAEQVNAERLSRLCSRACAPFEQALAVLTRLGRPTAPPAPATHQRLLLRALLDTATALLRHVSWRSSLLRTLAVGAYLRLRQEHPDLTQHDFCRALALPSRTLRHWLATPPPATACLPDPQPAPPPRRHRPARRPRFGFAATVPGTQLAADTTDLQAFGVGLKLVATQDVGDRDQDLLESIIVDDHESAQLVSTAIAAAIAGRPGMQVITDQGTPYLAQATRQALDELEAQHAPQVEGDPRGKATLERAFGSVKAIARPILELTARMAQAIPTLRRADLATAAATLLLTALLRAYQAGARATRRADEARATVTRADLEQVATLSREQAIANERSKRLLLTDLHQRYGIARPVADFIRGLRRFDLQVLRQAADAFALQAHRDDIRDRASYFAAIAARAHEHDRHQRARARQLRETLRRLDEHHCRDAAQQAAWRANPERWLGEALDAVAAQWIPARGELLAGGAGAARVWLDQAIAILVERHGPRVARDISVGVFAAFVQAQRDRLGEPGIDTLRHLLERHLPAVAAPPAAPECGDP